MGMNEMVRLDEKMLAKAAETNPIITEVLIARESGLFPEMKDVAVAITKAMAGREMGIGPMASQKAFHVLDINGKRELNPWTKYLASVAQHKGYYWHKIGDLATECELVFFHKTKGKLGTYKYTYAEAEAAGLTKNPVWQKHKKVMVNKSCLRHALMFFAPEILVAGINKDIIVNEPLAEEADDTLEATIIPALESEETGADTETDIQEKKAEAAEELCGKPPSNQDNDDDRIITQGERSRLFGAADEAGMSKDTFRCLLKDLYDNDSTANLKVKQFKYLTEEKLLNWEKNNKPEEGTKKYKVLQEAGA